MICENSLNSLENILETFNINNINNNDFLDRINNLLIANNINITKDTLTKYSLDINEWLESKEKCNSCTGLENCRQKNIGFYNNLKIYGNFIYNGYSRCSKLLNNINLLDFYNKCKSTVIPLSLKDKSYTNFILNSNNLDAYNAVKEFVNNFILNNNSKRGLILSGNTGCGKTHLASSAMNHLLSNNKYCIFSTVPELLEDLRLSYKHDNKNELTEKILEVDFLILDDFGSENITKWSIEQFFIIINKRLTNNKYTLLTMNYNSSLELFNKLASGREVDRTSCRRIVSRLVEYCDWVKITDIDRRINKL